MVEPSGINAASTWLSKTLVYLMREQTVWLIIVIILGWLGYWLIINYNQVSAYMEEKYQQYK